VHSLGGTTRRGIVTKTKRREKKETQIQQKTEWKKGGRDQAGVPCLCQVCLTCTYTFPVSHFLSCSSQAYFLTPAGRPSTCLAPRTAGYLSSFASQRSRGSPRRGSLQEALMELVEPFRCWLSMARFTESYGHRLIASPPLALSVLCPVLILPL